MDDDFVIDLSNIQSPADPLNREEREAMYAEGRLPERTYVSRNFELRGVSGVSARFVTKVFDSEAGTEVVPYADGTEWLVRESPKGRVQVKLLVAREPGHVSSIWIQRIRHAGDRARAESVLSLDGADAVRLVELIRNLDLIPVEGDDTIKVDDALVRELFASPESLTQLYQRDPALFRSLITQDSAAQDVVALERRRTEVERFRRLLDDADFFDGEAQRVPGRSAERVWQRFFEQNSWILGAGLGGGQLYTSWDNEKLEQVIAGSSVAHEGKRTDALMRTSGVVRWMTFAEFKTHRTPLLAAQYRPGTWPPSAELIGGVAQAQATVRRAMEDIGGVLRARDEEGAEVLGDLTFLTRPRSFLVAGHLQQLLAADRGPNIPKIHSFELFRRSLGDPEIVTFDELLARAESLVGTAD